MKPEARRGPGPEGQDAFEGDDRSGWRSPLTVRWTPVLAVALLLWVALHLGLQIVSWRENRQFFSRVKTAAELWRLGNLSAGRFGNCLQVIAARLPADSTTAFTAPGRVDETFLFAWAVYLLPSRRIVLRSDMASGEGASFVLSYGSGLSEAALSPVQVAGCGTLYRVAPGPAHHAR